MPQDQRLALMVRDHQIHLDGYVLDPMNVISQHFLGVERTQQLLEVRYGHEQMSAARRAAGLNQLD